MDIKQNKITDLVQPVLQRAQRVGSQPLDHQMIRGLVCEAPCTAGLVIAACGRDYYSQNTLGVNPAGHIKQVIMLK